MSETIKYLTPEQVAKQVEGLSAATIREMAQSGEIVAMKIGRRPSRFTRVCSTIEAVGYSIRSKSI